MLMTPFAIAPAKIKHRRFSPKAHSFESQLNYLWFDPEQISSITQQSWLWSDQHWNILNLYPKDFLSQLSSDTQHSTIRDKIAQHLAAESNATLASDSVIRILALPRTLGFRFNSVVFYFVLDAQQSLQFILSEITNTPWNERKVYVHDCRDKLKSKASYQGYTFEFDKSFHVSPFMPMHMQYRWHFHFSDQLHVIHMQLYQQDQQVFDATMRFKLISITHPSQQHRYALCYMLEPFKMMASIYMQALRLWIKKVPFYRHPNKNEKSE